MARPHIEFIQSADVEPRPWEAPGLPVAPVRTLSYDDETDAATHVLTLPAGWSASTGTFTADVELFVLDGLAQVGPYRLRRHSYAYIPAGICAGPWHVQRETTLLWMHNALLYFTPATTHSSGADQHAYIPCLETSAVPWGGTITPGFPPGAMRKSLRTDPHTGAGAWLLGVLPQWRDSRVEIHPVVEEAFFVQGNMTTGRGTMTAGCYFWRPPHIPHGPFHTDTGALIFFRTDGPLRTDYIWPEE